MSCARSSLGKIFNWSHWLYTKVLFNAISDVLLLIFSRKVSYGLVQVATCLANSRKVLYAGIGSNLLSSDTLLVQITKQKPFLQGCYIRCWVISICLIHKGTYILSICTIAHAISYFTKRSHICLSDEEYRYLYWVLAIGTYPQVILVANWCW